MADWIDAFGCEIKEEFLSPQEGLMSFILAECPWYFGRIEKRISVTAMAVTGDASTSTGTITGLIEFPGHVAPERRAEVLSRPLSDGIVRLFHSPDRRLRAELLRSSDQKLEPILIAISGPIQSSGPTWCQIAIRWTSAVLELLINGNVVATSDDSEPAAQVTLVSAIPMPVTKVDYSKENERAQLKRKGRVAGTHPIKGWRPKGRARDFEDLRNELEHLKDLLGLVRSGRMHNVLGVARVLRKLLIGTKGQIGVLQRCAGRIDAPVLVYTHDAQSVLSTHDYIERLNIIISSKPDEVHCDCVDIDVWLDFSGARVAGRDLKHREVLGAIGNTTAAHGDPDLSPVVEMLERFRSETPAGHGVHDFLVVYVIKLGEAVAAATEILLAIERPKTSS